MWIQVNKFKETSSSAVHAPKAYKIQMSTILQKRVGICNICLSNTSSIFKYSSAFLLLSNTHLSPVDVLVGTVIDFHFSCHLFRQPNSSQVEMPSIIPCVHKSHCVESSSSPSVSEALCCWPLHVITTLKMHSLQNTLSWVGSKELMVGRNGNVGNSDIHTKSSLQCIQVVDKLACWQFRWHCYQSLHHKQCCSSKRCLCFIIHTWKH